LPVVPHPTEDRARVETDTEADEEGNQRQDDAGGPEALLPGRSTITVLTSNPMAAELTASKGKAQSTARAAKANELFMKSAVDS
jgi:hypothetical protein